LQEGLALKNKIRHLELYDEDGDLVGPDDAAAATALVLKAKTAAAEGPTKQ
jgi:hypothetical protein